MAALDHVSTARPSRTPFRVCPPVLAFNEEEIESDNPIAGKYLKYHPSISTSGCFVAVLTREASEIKILIIR